MTQPVWLLRHAESEWNAAGRWQGRADPPLSERGRAQAEEAAALVEAALAERPIAEIYCSTLLRAIETARPVGARLGLDPIPVPELQELDVGRWAGLSTAEIRAREPDLLRDFESGDPDIRPGGGESRRELEHRVLRAITRLRPTASGVGILCVVHLGVVRVAAPGEEPGHVEIVSTTFDEIAARVGIERLERSSSPL
jgi:broad specificity phosphatase PhoE